MIKTYNMKDELLFSKQIIDELINYLENKSHYKVTNVQDDKDYMAKDIDILLKDLVKVNKKDLYKVEIKADKYYHTGNYFFEVISNTNKWTKGCFIYTESDYIFYYFVEPKELHIIPTKLSQKWFDENQHRYRVAETSTSQDGKHFYNTLGRLVTREDVINEVGVKVIKIGKEN